MERSRSIRDNAGLRHNGNVYVAADTTLEYGNINVFATVNTANGDITLILPPVGPSAGQFIYIYVTMANAKTLTVTDQAADAGMAVDLDMDADGDDVMLYSTGIHWIEVYNGIA